MCVCDCVCVCVIAWERKAVCGWGSLDCCSKVCAWGEGEGGVVCVCVWVCWYYCAGGEVSVCVRYCVGVGVIVCVCV